MPAFNKGTLSGNMVHTLKAPVDFNSGTTTDVVNMANYKHACIIIPCGAMTAATTVTLLACDDNTPTTYTAIKFEYRQMTDGAGATDTWGAKTACASTGLALSTANQTTVIELDAIDLQTETVQTLGVANRSRFQLNFSNPGAADIMCVVVVLSEPRYASQTPQTCID